MFIITYTSIHTYSANRTKYMHKIKQRPGERFLIFGRDKHTIRRIFSHTQIYKQRYKYSYMHMYIILHTCIQCILTYISKNIHTNIQTYMNMYMVGEDFQYHRRHINPLFPREMRSGSSN